MVEIDADDVTLDFNGFAITGSNVGTATSSAGPPVTASVSCSGSGSGAGVESLGIHEHFQVYGGFIRGMGGPALDLRNRVRIHDIEVDSCGDGILVSIGARVEDNLVHASGGSGIDVLANAVVLGNVVDGAEDDGIDASAYSVVAHNSVRACGGIGIAVAAASLVRDNTIDTIADHGIRTFGEGRVIDNVVSRVQNAAITGSFTTSAGVSGNSLDGSVGWEIGTFVELGPNLCGGSTTCP